MTTRLEIESIGGDDRWGAWMKCGVHSWQTLPRTESGEHYCPHCCTLWTAEGAIQNIPAPSKR
jgi:hypothetical protein